MFWGDLLNACVACLSTRVQHQNNKLHPPVVMVVLLVAIFVFVVVVFASDNFF